MSQQAQNDHYEHDAELALAYAAAVNAEIATCSPPARTSCRSTSRTCRRGPRRRASTGSTRSRPRSPAHDGTTAVHICFGYAAIIHERPPGYSFLPELAAVDCDQISIETAQSNLDTSVLEELPGKTIILGVLDLDDPRSSRPRRSPSGSGARCPTRAAGELVAAPDCGMKYLPRESAFGKLQSLAAGARLVRDG